MSVPQADVERLYDTVLTPKLGELEGLRLGLKQTITKSLVIVLVPFLLVWFGDIFALVLPAGAGFLTSIAGVLLVFAAVVFVGFRYLIPGFTAFINYRQRFKREVVAEIFRIVCPTAAYTPESGIPEAVFDEPGIFNLRGSFTSDDHVRGTIGQTPFEAAEVGRQYSTGGKNSTTRIVFKGLFFHLDFNKHVRGTTIVEPESAPAYRVGARDGLGKVALENPEFEQEFAVHADNEVEARYILTPVMMERLLSLRRRTGRPVYMAFKNNRAYLGVDYERALFEPAIASTTSKGAIEEMAELFSLAESIVHELDLNTRIWTKGVDTRLLERPDEEPKDALEAVTAGAGAGSLTAEQVWSAALASVGSTRQDEGAGPVPRPAHSSIVVERRPGLATIAYGGTVTLLITIAAWAIAVLLSLSALRALGSWLTSMTGMGMVGTLLNAIPAIPMADRLTATWPLVWFLAASSISMVLGLMWMARVRTVTIESDVVRVHRGLRPWPRQYPRPPYGKVIVIDRCVYIGKEAGLNLVNPSASPMLKVDEAQWVASEMRQALKETAR
jgi:Protein of unknown function (DUF3137)